MWLGGDGSREDSWKGPKNQGPLEQGKKICSSSKSKELLKLKPTGKTRNKPERQKSQNPGCHKPTPLGKSRPRDLVAQGTIGNILYSGILLSLGFPLLCIVFPW